MTTRSKLAQNMAAECRGSSSHMNGSLTHPRRCQWKPVCLATSNPFSRQIFCWSFEFSTGQRLQHNAPHSRDREIERDRAKREPTSTHRSQRPPPGQSRLRHRERQHPPAKEKQKLCHSLTGVGTGTRNRGEVGQGASRGQPCRHRRTEMGRARQKTDMQLRLLLWRPGWEL